MKAFELEIMKNRMISIPIEMGYALRRTSFSPNIKERMDASCAIFDCKGRMISCAEHIPVHLGSMPRVVEHVMKECTLEQGSQICMNAPYLGGTHLPDITLVKPIFFKKKFVGCVANRAHHADVGGKVPGSMPPECREIYEEGIIIPPTKIEEKGEVKREVLRLICSNSRTPWERFGDLASQIAANRIGEKRLIEFIERYGMEKYDEFVSEFFSYCKKMMKRYIDDMPRGTWEAEEKMEFEDVRIKVKIETGRKFHVGFSGTSPQLSRPLNAPRSVTESCVFFVLRCLTDPSIPVSSATFEDVKIDIPKGTILNPEKSYPVSAGNVETAQRVVDVILLALHKCMPERVPAQSQGTMNNISIGGLHNGEAFTYYETIGGGCGASYGKDGESALHTYMTNTMNTPIESLENYYPLTVLEYKIRRNSGGRGKWIGGDGIIRRIRIECQEAIVSVQSERRRYAPKGFHGGENGKMGENVVIINGVEKKMDGYFTIILNKDDEIVVNTPGGGGWGK